MFVGHAWNVLQLINQKRRASRLHVEKHEPKVDADARHERAKVATAQIELLRASVTHIF